MKIRNWTRKLSSALVAGGLLLPVLPAAVDAAPLNANLLDCADFECGYGTYATGQYLSGWQDGPGVDFAYFHSTGYANGSLASGGLLFFSSNFAFGSPNDGSDVLNPGEVAQSVDVSAGDSAALIASGQATYHLSGFFSSYGAQGDFGTMHMEFLDVVGGSLGVVTVSDSDTTDWTQESASGGVPIGTDSIVVSLYGTALEGGPDGYIDNVSLSIVPEPSSLALAGLGLAGAGSLLRRRQNK